MHKLILALSLAAFALGVAAYETLPSLPIPSQAPAPTCQPWPQCDDGPPPNNGGGGGNK